MNIDRRVLDAVQVNVPLRMLYETYSDLFLKLGLNPEIGLDADALENFTVLEVKEIVLPFHRNNRSITVHGPFLDLSPGSPDPAIREITRHRFEQLLTFVSVLKPKSVVCHLGYEEDRYGYIKETWFEKSLTMWTWFGEELRKAGSCLMIENVYEHLPDDMLPFFQRLQQHQVGFCLDVGHQAVFGKVPLSSWIKILGLYIGQIHLHDNRGERDEHLPLGKGDIDFSPIIHFLRNRHTLPLITLEPHEEKDLWPSLAYLKDVFSLSEAS
ncbi:MAG: sugar phosphate isomerase/epimerase family protein [Pseudomonadota bacterium]